MSEARPARSDFTSVPVSTRPGLDHVLDVVVMPGAPVPGDDLRALFRQVTFLSPARSHAQVAPEREERGGAAQQQADDHRQDDHLDQVRACVSWTLNGKYCCRLSSHSDFTAISRPARDQPADQPGDHALDQERQLDVEVRRADQAHDAGLPAAVERRQPDRVGHQQDGRDDQDDRDDHHRVPRAVEQLVELVQDRGVVRRPGPRRARRRPSWPPPGTFGLGVLELDLEGARDLVRLGVADQRRVARELLLELLVGLGLGDVGDAARPGIAGQLLADLR